MSLQLTAEQVWAALRKEIFAVLGMVNSKGEARTIGIVYINTTPTPRTFYHCPSAGGNWVGPFALASQIGTAGAATLGTGAGQVPVTGEYQPSDADLTAIAALSCTENQIIKRNGLASTTWLFEGMAAIRAIWPTEYLAQSE